MNGTYRLDTGSVADWQITQRLGGNCVQHGHAVAIADETFACGRCIAAAEKHGEPTFGMIPTSGCEVSNGKRRGRPAGATHLSRRGYEAVQP